MKIRQKTRARAGSGSALLLALLTACGGSDRPAAIPATELVALETPAPEYPIELACEDVGGEVILRVTVGNEGSPTTTELTRSSGVPALDAAAQEAVRTWRFRPATRNGQPVDTTIQVPVTFNPPAMRPDQCFALDERRRGEL